MVYSLVNVAQHPGQPHVNLSASSLFQLACLDMLLNIALNHNSFKNEVLLFLQVDRLKTGVTCEQFLLNSMSFGKLEQFPVQP